MSALSVTKTKDNETLTAVISGRIDTTTSPELDNEIKGSLDGISKLVLDFAKVEYISSSGLRVLLSLHKSMIANKGELIISKPTEMVLEVFEVTGFADMLNIEQ
ncbi:MAG: STAS domain-containing protein [Ruminiclostridium sp.]|nr:STAS domain-containing protein [Ruminiclostridium sp.]MBP3855528.1 STAS domain-containing protein [Ruminiclostridium sp.]